LSWLGAVLLLVALPAAGQIPEDMRLQVGDVAEPARFTAGAPGERKGVVMLLPDGLGPRATGLAEALATGLARHGWDVVDVRAGILRHEAAFAAPEALAGEMGELVAAVRSRTRDRRRPSDIYVVGHGWGGILAGLYLDGRADPPVAGLAVLNAAPPPRLTELGFQHLLPGITVPVMDIWSGRSYLRVTGNAEARSRAAGVGRGDGFRQLELAVADHHFTDREDWLVKRLRGWLKRQRGD